MAITEWYHFDTIVADPMGEQWHRVRDLRVRCSWPGMTRATRMLTCKSILAYRAAVADVFDALAAPARRAILDVLSQRNDQTLFEICGRLASDHDVDLTRQAISQHLAILEEDGLVHTRRGGRYKFHSIDSTPIRSVLSRWLDNEETQ